MSKQIIFTDMIGVQPEYSPIPAANLIPEWYKNIGSYINGKKEVFVNGKTDATIKKCMPVFDAFTAGYIIVSYVDVYVRIEDGAPYFDWTNYEPISFPPLNQQGDHPQKNQFSAPKWTNPWSIKVPKGYSILFTPPLHRENKYFEILEGVVDCDTYTNPVNFPFIMKDSLWEGLIPAGTPIAQVIPFKRDDWTSVIGGDENRKESIEVLKKIKITFWDGYKTMFRTKKEFK